jgi:DNA-binding CsgD family transcriptional regulator
LSIRERQVLCLFAEGKSAKEIARLLDISDKTVQSHRVNILEKLELPNTASLVLYAIRGGLVEGPPAMVSPNACKTLQDIGSTNELHPPLE